MIVGCESIQSLERKVLFISILNTIQIELKK